MRLKIRGTEELKPVHNHQHVINNLKHQASFQEQTSNRERKKERKRLKVKLPETKNTQIPQTLRNAKRKKGQNRTEKEKNTFQFPLVLSLFFFTKVRVGKLQESKNQSKCHHSFIHKQKTPNSPFTSISESNNMQNKKKKKKKGMGETERWERESKSQSINYERKFKEKAEQSQANTQKTE